MERPSYLLDIPSEEYHAATKRNEFVTSHRLNLFRQCPALYKKTIDGEIVEGDTAAFQLGRATHTYILEGEDAFNNQFVVSDGPINPKTENHYGKNTKAYAEWLAAQPAPVISTDDHALIQKMSATVHAHPAAAKILSSGIAEASVRAIWHGIHVQSRIDWFIPPRGILTDLKTCNDIDKFGYDIRDFGYVNQLAFYEQVLKLAGYDGPDIHAFLIAVEKKEPFRVAVFELFPMTLNDGNFADYGTKYGPGNDLLMQELKECMASNVWPTRYEEVIRL